MKVLVACEESQRVCIAFRKRGHEAFSCDILPCSGGHPEYHIQGDVLPILNGRCFIKTMDNNIHQIAGKWDLIIAHPPCTYLCVTGNRWFNVEKYGKKALKREESRRKAAAFFMAFTMLDCMWAIENPVGVMSTWYRKPDQIIQPYYFGDPVRKATCLWLHKLPMLKPTKKVEPEIIKGHYSGPAWAARDENGKILAWNDPRTAVIRSRTYQGIAEAMAEQWG